MNICLSHRTRIKVNEILNRPYVGIPGSRFIEKDPKVPERQDVSLFPEIRLVCVKTGLGMTNGSFWTVTGVSPIILESGGSVVKIPDDKFQSHLRLASCLVAQQTQGRTLEGTICILEMDHPRWTEKHSRVCLSRATDKSNLSIAPNGWRQRPLQTFSRI